MWSDQSSGVMRQRSEGGRPDLRAAWVRAGRKRLSPWRLFLTCHCARRCVSSCRYNGEPDRRGACSPDAPNISVTHSHLRGLELLLRAMSRLTRGGGITLERLLCRVLTKEGPFDTQRSWERAFHATLSWEWP